jgi:hypothetical protein
MSSDDGGVLSVSSSSRVRRARSSLGTFPGGAAELFARDGAFGRGRLTAFLGAAALGAAFLLAFLAGAFFLADARRFSRRFGTGRRAGRRAIVFLARGFADFLPLAAFRLAMDTSFRNLDSLAISVVLSVAYRNSEKPSGGRHPLKQPPAISD